MPPDVFAVGSVTAIIIRFLTMFGDLGLGGALIQSERSPDAADKTGLLLIQLLVASALCVCGFAVSPSISAIYHLPLRDRWLVGVVALGLLPSAVQSVGIVSLERVLSYPRVARIEGVRSLVASSSLAVLAVVGVGGMSFAWSALAGSLCGALTAVQAAPWRFQVKGAFSRLRELLYFGVPYQLVSMVSLVKDSFAPVVLGLVVGMGGLGQYQLASSLAVYPVILANVISRMFFPMFSRMREDGERFVEGANNLHFLLMTSVASASSVMGALSEPIIRTLFGASWLMAVNLFYWLEAGLLFVPGTIISMAILNAVNRSRANLAFSAMWATVEWLVGLPLVHLFGIDGYGMAVFIDQFTNLVVYWYSRRVVPVAWWRNSWQPLVSGFMNFVILALLQHFLLASTVALLLFYGLLGFLVFFLLLFMIAKARILSGYRLLKGSVTGA